MKLYVGLRKDDRVDSRRMQQTNWLLKLMAARIRGTANSLIMSFSAFQLLLYAIFPKVSPQQDTTQRCRAQLLQQVVFLEILCVWLLQENWTMTFYLH